MQTTLKLNLKDVSNKMIENWAILIPERNSYCRSKKKHQGSRFKVLSERFYGLHLGYYGLNFDET